MDEIKDFDSLYTDTLLPLANKLKSEAKQTFAWKVIGIICPILIFILFFSLDIINKSFAGYSILFLVVLFIFCIYKYSDKKDSFTDDYKATVIKQIITYINPKFTYLPDKSISKNDYIASSLIRYIFTYFNGGDFIEGTYKNVYFHFSAIRTLADRAADAEDDAFTIFKGFFIITNVNCSGCTYIWRRNAAQLPSSVIDEYARLLPMPSVDDVSFDDAEFNKYFRVCSNYAAEAIAILTPERRNDMIKLGKYLDKPISFSFVRGNCYTAIPTIENVLRPYAFDPSDKNEIKNDFDTINLIPTVIDYLKLNEL